MVLPNDARLAITVITLSPEVKCAGVVGDFRESCGIEPQSNLGARAQVNFKPHQSTHQGCLVSEGQLLTPTELGGRSILECKRFA